MADVAAAAALARPRRGLVAPAGASADALRTLRLSVAAAELADGRRRALLFTSAEPEAGKSTLAANYALVASLAQARVLVIDGDLRRPVLHELFGVRRSPGLVDALASTTSVREFVIRSTSSLGHLDVLTSGRAVGRPGDLMSSERMAEILAEATEAYDLVVIDSPPVLSAPDAASLASHPSVDVLLVVRTSSKRRAVRRAVRRLELIDARLRGVVVNREGRLSAYGGY